MATPLPQFDAIPTPAAAAGLLREARVWADLAGGLRHVPHALLAARGHDEPVLLLPGYTAGDGSTWLLRRFLRQRGWDARGWGLGTNGGDAPGLLPRVIEVAARIAKERGRPLHLVGWSLGGFLARELARDRADLVRQVVTMGTPVVGGPKYTALASMFRSRGHDLDAIEAEIEARARRKIAVPITAIYSRRDGVVAWQACVDRTSPRVEHVEVSATHFGLGFDLRVWRVVADRLARHANAGRAAQRRAAGAPAVRRR